MAGYLIGGRLVAGGGKAAGEITLRAIAPRRMDVELVLNDAERMEFDVRVPLVDVSTRQHIDLANELVPGRDFIGWVEDGVLKAAGPLWADPWSAPGTSTLHGEGLLSYFDHRRVLPVLRTGQLPRDVTSRWADLSLRTIAKRLVQQACSHPGSGLPIDYEPDIAGDHEREYPGGDLTIVAEALRNISGVEGGPDITFRPRMNAERTRVRWALMTGSPEIRQDGVPHYWDSTAEVPFARLSGVERDARELASRDYQLGATLQNLLGNPSFEEGVSEWEVGRNAKDLENGAITPAHGRRYGRWAAIEPGEAHIDSRRTSEAAATETFTFSASCRSANNRPMRLMLSFLDADGEPVAQRYGEVQSVAQGSAWTRLVHRATAPAGARSVQAHVVGVASAANQTFAVDRMMLTRGSELFPYRSDEIQLQAVASYDALLNAGFPFLESSTTRGTVLRTPTLQAYAAEAVLRNSAHIETIRFTAQRRKQPQLRDYWPGDQIRIKPKAAGRLSKTEIQARIIRVNFDKAGDVSIECAPQRVVSGYPVPSGSKTWFRDKLRALSRRIDNSR